MAITLQNNSNREAAVSCQMSRNGTVLAAFHSSLEDSPRMLSGQFSVKEDVFKASRPAGRGPPANGTRIHSRLSHSICEGSGTYRPIPAVQRLRLPSKRNETPSSVGNSTRLNSALSIQPAGQGDIATRSSMLVSSKRIEMALS